MLLEPMQDLKCCCNMIRKIRGQQNGYISGILLIRDSIMILDSVVERIIDYVVVISVCVLL